MYDSIEWSEVKYDRRNAVKINIPDNVKHIIAQLEGAGFEAWAVGGCVRDSLMGRDPKDWDITTSALPEQIKSIFRRTIDTGIAHGTVTVMLDGVGYETTTYRIDGKYSDSRHPDSIEFTRSLGEDLKRRDFTINAMAYSDTKGLVDLFGGASDLKNHIIRCVGDPSERFAEDALRILRAIRFSAQLGFEVDPHTMKATSKLKDRLNKISAERIHSELDKTLLSPYPERFRLIHSSGIDSVILPELSDSIQADPLLLKNLCGTLKNSPKNGHIRWAVLLSATGGNIGILKRLKFDNNSIHIISELLRLEKTELTGLTDSEMRHIMYDAGAENLPLLFQYRQTLHPDTDLSPAEAQYRTILERGDCTCIKDLNVKGTDLLNAGVPSGAEIGITLRKLLEEVLNDPSLNTKELLLDKVKQWRG